MKGQQKTDLIDAVMNQLLDGDHRYLEVLREQYRAAETDIDETKSGFFVEFDVPAEVDTVPIAEDFHFGDVEATMQGIDHGIGFVLFIRDGVISELEGYTYEETLPESIVDIDVVDIGERDPAMVFPDENK